MLSKICTYVVKKHADPQYIYAPILSSIGTFWPINSYNSEDIVELIFLKMVAFRYRHIMWPICKNWSAKTIHLFKIIYWNKQTGIISLITVITAVITDIWSSSSRTISCWTFGWTSTTAPSYKKHWNDDNTTANDPYPSVILENWKNPDNNWIERLTIVKSKNDYVVDFYTKTDFTQKIKYWE